MNKKKKKEKDKKEREEKEKKRKNAIDKLSLVIKFNKQENKGREKIMNLKLFLY